MTATPAAVLDLARWSRPPDAADTLVLDRCTGPTLDVGCGPGRMVLALAQRRVPALGIDMAADAIRQVRERGGLALQRSVFDSVPGEGRWQQALLLDGCLGIGGAPSTLLARIRELLGPDGTALVEHDPDPDRAQDLIVMVRDRTGRCGEPFAWTVLGARTVVQAARVARMDITDTWSSHGRTFAALVPAVTPGSDT